MMSTSNAVKQATQNRAFQLKGSLFTLTVLQLLHTDSALFAEQLDELVKQAPKFFQATPVVLDLQLLDESIININFQELCELLQSRGMVPIGIRGGSDKQQFNARALGLAVLTASKNDDSVASSSNQIAQGQNASRSSTETTSLTSRPKQSRTQSEPETPTSRTAESSTQTQTQKTTSTTPTQPGAATTMVVARPIRSGQQIYSPNGDLTIIGSVSEGAELLATGSIHVYGALRGRALAGINGDTTARIFCRALNAELVSIAGVYIASESLCLSESSQSMQIYYADGRLHLDAF